MMDSDGKEVSAGGKEKSHYRELDVKFDPQIMQDPETGNDWFGEMTLDEARKADLDYIAEHHLDEDETYGRVSENMAYFTDIGADMVITNYMKEVSRWEDGDYIIEIKEQSKGFQTCPWQDGVWWYSGTDTTVTNKKTGVVLLVNSGTAHMADKHHILEKGEGNPYATSVESFMENFGKVPQYSFTDGRYSQRGKE